MLLARQRDRFLRLTIHRVGVKEPPLWIASDVLKLDCLVLPSVNCQCEHIESVVMPSDVVHLLGLDALPKIDLGIRDSLIIDQGRRE